MKKALFALLPLALLISSGCSDDAGETQQTTENPPAQTTETAPPEESTPPETEDNVTTSDAAAPAAAPETAAVPETPDPQRETAEGTVKAIIESVSGGDAGAIWAALPEGHQNDVTELVQGFGNGMDRIVWKQVHGIVGKIHGLLDTKTEFIVGSQLVQESGQAEMVKVVVPAVAGLLKTILDSTTLEALKSFDGQQFFSGPASQLLKQGDSLAQIVPDAVSLASLSGATVETISDDDDKATLKITSPEGEAEEVEFVRVDGHWLPADIQNDWDSQMASAKEGLATLPDASKQLRGQVPMIAGMITGTLAPLEAAQDQEQFDTALAQAQAAVMPLILGAMGGGGPFGGGGDAGAPSPGFDSGFETEDVEVAPEPVEEE